MSSAASFGGRSSRGPSLNPLRMPSVAKISVSPRATGSELERSGGS